MRVFRVNNVNGSFDQPPDGSGSGQITLGEGACPSSGLYDSDISGQYSFVNYHTGAYCVTFTPGPGDTPTTSTQVTINLGSAETITVDFGYQTK